VKQVACLGDHNKYMPGISMDKGIFCFGRFTLEPTKTFLEKKRKIKKRRERKRK